MHGMCQPCVTPIELSGEIHMDFNSDRISDFMVYYLSEETASYKEYMRIPLTKAASNITDCMEWMVRCCLSVILFNWEAYFTIIFVMFVF